MEEKLKGALWGMLICFIITLMFGCRSVKYVPVTSVKTDSIFIYDTSKVVNKIRYTDSLRIIDSIIVVQDTAGKTIYKEKHHSETRTKSNEMKRYERSFIKQCTIYKNRNISTPFRLIVDVYYPDYTHDLDNSLKGLLDNLQYCGAISNDNLCMEIVAKRHYDKYEPRVQFRIEELNEQKQLFY